MALGIVPPVSTVFVTICKKAYKPVYDDNDILLISNDGALRQGLEALLKEDSSDKERADQYWADAIRILQSEEKNLIGASAEGTAQVDDSFNMHAVGVGL